MTAPTDPAARAAATERQKRIRRRRWLRTGRRVGLGLAAAAILLAAWVGIRGYAAVRELQEAGPLASALQADVLNGDGAAAALDARSLAGHTSTAVSLTGDVLWRAAEFVPWAGENLAVFRELVTATDSVAHGAVLPLVDVAATVSLADLKPVDSRIRLQPLIDARPEAARARAALAAGAADVASIDGSHLVPPLAEARDRLAGLLDGAARAADGLDRAVRLVPLMLGAEGPRNYVLLFQNNAELRSSGGITGALALVHTDGGSFSLARQASSTDLPAFSSPVLDLPTETRALYGVNTAQYIQDVNFTPRFELSGRIAAEMWRRRFGVTPDGVLSVDPVALGYLLAATGPIRLDTGETLTSENVARFLLKDVYTMYPKPLDQDRFFAQVTAKVFSALGSGRAAPQALVRALIRAGGEGRVLVYSARDAEQQVLADTSLGGALPVSSATSQGFGVYLNDGTGAKMGTYLSVGLSTGTAVCRNDRLPNYEVRVTLENTAPPDAAMSLPPYVTGAGGYGVTPGDILTSLSAYSTLGSYNLGVRRDGKPAAYQASPDGTYTLSRVSVLLKPGESTVLVFRFLGGEPGAKAVTLTGTPMPALAGVTSHEVACERAVN